MVSGQPLAALAENCAPARLVRSLPLISAEVGASPTLLYPDDAIARDIFADLGPVLPLAAEDDFTAASAYGPAFSCLFALMDCMRAFGETHGVDPENARALAAQCMIGAGALVAGQPEKPIAAPESSQAVSRVAGKVGLGRFWYRLGTAVSLYGNGLKALPSYPGGACTSVSYCQTVPGTGLMQPLPRKPQPR